MPIWLQNLAQDVRWAIRGLVHNPLFALAAISAAALGIGSTTAVFSVVDRILLRPLPYGHEDRLVSVGIVAPLDTNEFMFASEYFDLRHNPGPFEALTSFQAGAIDCDLTERNPLRLQCLRVEANFLDALGMAPVAGGSFTPEQDLPNGPRVVMISYGLWQSRFLGDPAVIGRTLPLDGIPSVIVGVLPKNFETPTLTRADILLSLALNEATEHEGRALRVFARMKPGMGVPQAIAQLQPHFQRTLLTVPPQFRKEVTFRILPLRERQIGDVRLASLALVGSVVSVLLIACANIANLLLARAVARDRQMSVRIALGASRVRLIAQTLSESLLIAGLGCIAGCALAFALVRIFVAIAPGGLPRLEEAAIDLRVLLFATAISAASGILFGIAPALRTPRAEILGGWRSTAPSRSGLRSTLVTLQIAISLVLITSSGLLLRSLWKLENVPLGMERSHVLITHFVLSRERYTRELEQVAFFRDLEQRIAAIPGVEFSAITDSVPPLGVTRGRPLNTIAVEGHAAKPDGTGGMTSWRYVTPKYFAVLGIPLRRGRAFDDRDRDPNANAVILTESLARRMFPNEDALGKRILKDGDGPWFTVIGLTADVKNRGPEKQAAPEYYLVRKAFPDAVFHRAEPPTGWRSASVIARTTLDPQLMASAIRAAVAAQDATLPVEMQTMEERVDQTTARPRFNALLLAVFAAMGASLAAIGLFGVMSFLVAQRTREIGVRMALGATPADVLRLILGHAMKWTAAGLLLGTAGAFAATRALRSLLFQVEPADPIAALAALLLLSVVAFVAALGPARRAARQDPSDTLRHE